MKRSLAMLSAFALACGILSSACSADELIARPQIDDGAVTPSIVIIICFSCDPEGKNCKKIKCPDTITPTPTGSAVYIFRNEQ